MENENNNNNNENNINTNDFYHEDNSFNENGINTGANDNSYQFSTANRGNSIAGVGKGLAEGFKAGLNPNKYNPALGVNGAQKNPSKGSPNKKNGKPSNNNKNPAKGQKDSEKRKNPLPGGMNKDKKDNTNNNKNTNKPNQNDKNKDKNKGFGSKLNPLNRGGIGSKLGLGKKKNDNSANNTVAPNLNQVAKKGLKLAWAAAPIPVKIVIMVSTLLPIILIILLALFLGIFGGTTAAVTAAMCGGEGTSGSSYNGEGYTGENNAKAFACSMQHPTAYKGTVTSLAGPRWGRIHAGVDIGVPTGTNIYAGQAGVVVTASYEGSYGNLVVIQHTDTISTKYAHNSKLLVKKGDKVGKGQLIAKSGNTGRSTGPHTHIEIVYKGSAQHELENSYFDKHESFKKNCGSSWSGELAGDSAKQANDTSGVEDISYESNDSSNEQCCDTSSSSNVSSGDYCPNGIVVEGVGTLDLDDYVAGVVSAENSYKDSKDPNNIEAMKAQAIASRTYAVNSTNNCTKKIGNSQASQVYTSPNERAKKAATETAGAVMTYNGNVFSAQYDAFCMNDKDCPDASCSGTTCSVTYTKVPSSDKHKITVKSPHSKNVYSGGYNGAGHAHGMSQLVARQMQDEGKKYDEILKFFYADGISISGISSNQCTLGRGSFDGKIWFFDQTDYKEPYGSYGTIATHGCGPTAMAIAVSSLLNEEHDPVELTNYACSNNYCTNEGTKHSFFAAAGKKYGLKVKRVSKSNSDEIFTALNGGNSIVIAIMGPGTFTNGGHFITLTGSNGNQVFVHDPNNGDGKKYNKLWDFDLIKKEASGDSPFWIISK